MFLRRHAYRNPGERRLIDTVRRTFAGVVLLFTFLAGGSPWVLAQDKHDERQDRVVARVYETMINAASIEPALGLKENKQAEFADDLGYRLWYRSYRRMLLSLIVANQLKTVFVEEHGLQPTEREIGSYLRFQERGGEKRFDELLYQREAAAYRLENEQLTVNEAALHKSFLAAADFLIDQEFKNHKTHPKDSQFQDRRAEKSKARARQAVLWWKFHKGLYEKYGGRVIVQTRGWEALDAYQLFLQEHEQKGTFEVLDPDLTPLFVDFQEYYHREDHKFVEEEQAILYFTAPWWERGDHK
jgi:hypothetical protein